MMLAMWKQLFLGMILLGLVLATTSCGYKMVRWSSDVFQTMAIAPVDGSVRAEMKLRLRDALIERTLAGSGLKPVDSEGHLVLKSQLLSYGEQVIATDVDGRTRRLQFNMRVSFQLSDAAGNEIRSLKNYQYSDQYSITTRQDTFRDETVFVQDDAMRSIADLVVTNITLAVAEWEQRGE